MAFSNALKIIGIVTIAVLIFWVGMSALDSIQSSFDEICISQFLHVKCSLIGNYLYRLRMIVWLAAFCVPLAILALIYLRRIADKIDL